MWDKLNFPLVPSFAVFYAPWNSKYLHISISLAPSLYDLHYVCQLFCSSSSCRGYIEITVAIASHMCIYIFTHVILLFFIIEITTHVAIYVCMLNGHIW